MNLLAQQAPEGYWCGELEGDSILQSEYVLLKWIIRGEEDPRLPRIANHLRSRQRSDGAWVQYPGAAPHLSATTKAYFALKLAGDDPQSSHMAKAREVVISLGGAERCDTYSKFYLAALGQLDYANVPAIPPEMVLLPRWFFFHLDKISAWSRTMIMPLAIVRHFRPVRSVPPAMDITELFCDPAFRHQGIVNHDCPRLSWQHVFLQCDRFLKIYDEFAVAPLRRAALRRIERWIVHRSRNTDGLGAIFPSMVYILIAMRCLGYGSDSEPVRQAQHELDRFMIEEDDTIHLQPCFSPVWDTGIAAYALSQTKLPDADWALERAGAWLLSKECRTPGDWQRNVKIKVEPSGWFFEFHNPHYPDVDDTAMVLMALRCGRYSFGEGAIRRGVRWILSMQNDDGGWAAFDRTVHRPLLEAIPFADHNAIQDPSCPDITGRTLECLAQVGFHRAHPVVTRAIRFIRSHQEPEGCWFGRWGVNYIYGTWQVLCGLQRIGLEMDEHWIQEAGRWLKGIQHDDGSFGESANSYEDSSLKGIGPHTASQTAWGTMSLMAVYAHRDRAVRAGIDWLCGQQRESGTWDETWFTGTGFPRVFYLRYDLYRLYFPIMCLGRYVEAGKSE